jgi:hypothetical protein
VSLVAKITLAPAGIIPPGGSIKRPHRWIVAFKAAVVTGLVHTPLHVRAVFAHVTFKLAEFNEFGPTKNRTISFAPSTFNDGGVQASTKIFSISKQEEMVCAFEKLKINTNESNRV